MSQTFAPSRTAALEALSAFVPKAGKYAATRNYDRPGHPDVSRLSPYIRHRILTETDVLEAVLGRYAPSTVEKFVQEVFWRTYWKGWLERRPSVWMTYRAGVTRALDRVASEGGLRKGWETACQGTTGIDAFDHWAHELVETGYLHNHARMWFASIWCFTLRLPWELGADFFLRHLLDGDPASNTLGWRWVAGLQTPGKVYEARSSNITKYTEGRFGGIHGLAHDPTPLEGLPNPPLGPVPENEDWDRSQPVALLVTEEDLSLGWVLDQGLNPIATAGLMSADGRSPLAVATPIQTFTQSAMAEALDRYKARLGIMGPVTDQVDQLAAWASQSGVRQLVTSYAPMGPTSERLDHLAGLLRNEGIALRRPIRPYDQAAWPHATAGFFKFKAKIPNLIRDMGLAKAA